jgi:hypothetical protein
MRSAGMGSLRRSAPTAALSSLAVAAALVASGCMGAFAPFGRPGAAVPATFPTRAEPDPGSACVARPDPANGGQPAPPEGVVAAGDPADPTGVVAIDVVGLGDLILPSDEVFVADLFFLGGDPADLDGIDLMGFTGPAAVCLHVARYELDERVAFVHVLLTDEAVVTWRETSGFGVDSGTGGLGSAEATVAAGSGSEALGEQYLEDLEQHRVNTWTWLNITVDPASGANIIGFSTGFGDGGYPVVVGDDAEGRPASIVIDHVVVPWDWLSRVGQVP